MDNYFLADPLALLWPHKAEDYWYDIDTHPTVQCARTLSAYNKGDKAEFLKGVNWLIEATGELSTTDKVTLEENLHQFDLNLPYCKWSRYDNCYHFFAPAMYHRIMIQQLEWLAEKIGSQVCKGHAEKWRRQEELYGRDCKARYIMLRVRSMYNTIIGE